MTGTKPTRDDGSHWPGAIILALPGRKPELHEECWLAPGSAVSGSVTIGARSSIWYGASVRGDAEQITLGQEVNLQDNAVIHADLGSPAHIDDRVSVGHAAVLHGCKVGSGSVIGMGAVVLNGAVIGQRCLVAAGAVVLEDTVVPDGMLVAGVPAKVRRGLTQDELAGMEAGILGYVGKAADHRAAVLGGGLGPEVDAR
ncbi:MAG: gamma carbonic anhydrase family protein [Ornithinimicrobium sp.]|uniref:gamma carbonic anhydrase family protein n=1 Tax=Ornithinimicrobium sp. TaxID=1977084 RepID=UPI0026DF520C|nr:gamma carbonic anhydrase family protein [Ornithinimicrobium sp.]MDO5738808.1 gamma carbonic anhydrase family protein [Ornithinimicrobium sp.]